MSKGNKAKNWFFGILVVLTIGGFIFIYERKDIFLEISALITWLIILTVAYSKT
jgi:hypothetical protein